MLGELLLVTSILLSAADVQPDSVPDRPFDVVVNRSNPLSSLTRAELSAIFMKKVRSWPDRSEVLPVDQALTSRVRELFSRSIHGKSVAYVTRYWHRLIFAGRDIPPRQVDSNAAVIDFVKANHGAIGYVDTGTPLVSDVKVIAVTP